MYCFLIVSFIYLSQDKYNSIIFIIFIISLIFIIFIIFIHFFNLLMYILF